MKRILTVLLAAVSGALPLAAAGAMTPGLYEYNIKMNMPGAPAAMPAQTVRHCLTAKDVAGDKMYEMPADKDSDCRIRDLVTGGGKFSYRIVCTKPQKMDGSARGTVGATGMTMDMTMTMAGTPGPITQSVSAKRVGECPK